MSTVAVCVGCLASEVRMCSMSATGLLRPYQLISGRYENAEMLDKLCWECAALVYKFHSFRRRCETAQDLLTDIFTHYNEITEEAASKIDRRKYKLESQYKTMVLYSTSYLSKPSRKKSKIYLKPIEKTVIKEESDLKAEELKSEDDSTCLQLRLDSSPRQIELIIKQDKSSISANTLDCNVPFNTKSSTKARSSVTRKKEKAKIRKTLPKYRVQDIEADEIILTQEQQMETIHNRQSLEGFKGAKYKCMMCYKTFNETNTFQNHMTQHDPISGPMQCDICKLRYDSRKKIYKHISNNHLRKYACRLCSHVCYNRSFAINHNRWHKGVTYKCDICGSTFDKMTSHRNHMRIKHPSEHVCRECGDSFVSQLGVMQHLNKMHPGRKIEGSATGPYCETCCVQFSSQQAWTRHVLISPKHTHERDIIDNGCHYCGETFQRAEDFKRHFISEHRKHRRVNLSQVKQFPVPCSLCSEPQQSAGKYWQHFRTCHPGKPFPLTRSSFICEYCGNWFKNKSALDVHKQTHNVNDGKLESRRRERRHACACCDKTFAYDCNLKKHELTVHCTPTVTK